MSLTMSDQSVPLTAGRNGVVRVGGTRVTLDTLVEAFAEGATPETITQQYPSLSLADVYAVIAYYLHHRSEVDAYLRQRAKDARKVRKVTESRFDPVGVRARLLARRPKKV